MQPYQEESTAIKKQGELPFTAAKTASYLAPAIGAGAVAGSQLLKRVAPFLSSYLPENLAIKGLSKLDPRLGKFIQTAQANGQTWGEIKDFIGSKFQQEEKVQPAKEKRNIIEMESPELHQFIEQNLKGGRKLLESGALAQNDKKFSNIVKKLEKQHKTPWSQILQSVYGMGEQAQSQQQIQQPSAQPQQVGPGAQALLQAVQELVKIRGAR
jgi:hypothetical protein